MFLIHGVNYDVKKQHTESYEMIHRMHRYSIFSLKSKTDCKYDKKYDMTEFEI